MRERSSQGRPRKGWRERWRSPRSQNVTSQWHHCDRWIHYRQRYFRISYWRAEVYGFSQRQSLGVGCFWSVQYGEQTVLFTPQFYLMLDAIIIRSFQPKMTPFFTFYLVLPVPVSVMKPYKLNLSHYPVSDETESLHTYM